MFLLQILVFYSAFFEAPGQRILPYDSNRTNLIGLEGAVGV